MSVGTRTWGHRYPTHFATSTFNSVRKVARVHVAVTVTGERARAELDFIAGELASAFGLGGRSRRADSPIERARKAVASRIRFSLGHIARVHPPLARHLRRYIRTGTVCTYVVPDEPVRWRV